MTRIIGIDPGIATTGVGIIDQVGHRLTPIYWTPILTPAKMMLPDRLMMLSSTLDDILQIYQPQLAAVEELFFNTNVKTAITVGQARGVILLTLAKRGLPVTGYTPVQVKSAVCGYGHAQKQQIQLMVQRLLNLEMVPKPDDVADALAIAVCHGHSNRIKSLS